MVRPRWRKVISDLWDNKARTLLVVASIAIGVFAVGMIAASYVIIPEAMNTSYSGSDPANISIITDDLDQDFIERIRRLEGVAEAEGRRQLSVRVRVGSGEWTSIDLTVIPDFEDQRINRLHAEFGQAIPDDNELILLTEALEELNTEVGDTLEIQLVDGTLKSMPVAGTVRDRTSGIDGIVFKKKGFVTFGTLEWLHESPNYNQIVVRLADNQNDMNHIRAMLDRITEQLEDSGRQVYRAELSRTDSHPVEYIVQAIIGILALLGILIMFLSSSLIANTLNSLIGQQMRQIGVMKLIGARRNQIITMYLALILAFGLIALVIAVPLGGWAANQLAFMVTDLLNIQLTYDSQVPLIPFAIFTQTIIALVIPVLAGIIPVVNGSRVTVQEAINSVGLQSGPEKSRFGALRARMRRISRPTLISIRNTFRRKGRLMLTLFTLSLGGAIFISVFNVRVSLDQKVQDITRYFTSDVNLIFDRSYRIDEVRAIAGNIPGIVHVEGWAEVGAEVLNPDGSFADNLLIMGPPPESELIVPIMLDGRWLHPEDERAIVVNEAFLDDYPDLAPGDTLRLEIEGQKQTWMVVGVFQYAGLDQLFAYANYEPISKAGKQYQEAASFRIIAADHSLEYQKQLSAQVDTYFRDLGYQVREVEAGGSYVKTITELLDVLILVLLILAVLTALVGSIGLTGTLSMNVLERTREIGVLRAIGAYNRIVIKLVVIEGLVIGLISYLLAVALSFPITGVLSEIISQAIFNSPANFAFTASGFLVWLAFVLVLAATASIGPARNASRMTIREVLAYE